MLRLLILLCVLGLACGDDDSTPMNDSGTSDSGGDDGGADDGGDDAGGDDAGGDDAGDEDAGADDAGTDDAGGEVACGARLGDTCQANEYCDFPDDICGAADGTGICRPRPMGCPDVEMPVCGCDGVTHSNGCEANTAGSDVNRLGSCTPPAESFACGFRFCPSFQYCRVIIDDTGMPPAYECDDFPSPCDGGGRDCTCVADVACGDMCEADEDGNVTVTCPGG